MLGDRKCSDARFDEDALDSAFEYAVSDGFYTQAAVLIKDGKLVKERYRGITDKGCKPCIYLELAEAERRLLAGPLR